MRSCFKVKVEYDDETITDYSFKNIDEVDGLFKKLKQKLTI